MSEYEPITAELRRVMNHTTMAGVPLVEIGEYEFAHRCDEIDAVHAALERVAELDKRGDSMHDGGSITGELRDWWVRKFPVMDKELHKDFTAIADRIDAEHESACAEAYGNGVMSVPIALDESQWVKLPLDADGVPIRVGDEVVDELDESTAPRKVTSLYLANDGWWVYIGGVGRRPDRYRHHHAPTVEDVLREMLDAWGELPSNATNEAIVAEYAAKLRLAGDAS